jgi:hypothetical protein
MDGSQSRLSHTALKMQSYASEFVSFGACDTESADLTVQHRRAAPEDIFQRDCRLFWIQSRVLVFRSHLRRSTSMFTSTPASVLGNEVRKQNAMDSFRPENAFLTPKPRNQENPARIHPFDPGPL